MDWHLLVWGKSKSKSHQAQEGDIIDVMPATTEWRPNNMETRLCIIIPITGLTRIQAMRLKESGIITKRKYKIALDDLEKVKTIDKSKIRDDKKYYQPLLDESKIDLKNDKIVKDKMNDVVNVNSLEFMI